jgi:hypothetical protein
MKEQLIRIYNTLSLISTKGEDTVTMAQCLIAINQLIEEMNEDKQKQEEE